MINARIHEGQADRLRILYYMGLISGLGREGGAFVLRSTPIPGSESVGSATQLEADSGSAPAGEKLFRSL